LTGLLAENWREGLAGIVSSVPVFRREVKEFAVVLGPSQKQKLSEGTDTGALYVNWELNQPRAVLLEDCAANSS